MEISSNNLGTYSNSQKKLSSVQEEMLKGICSKPKYISSKFFYDKKGSELFSEISTLEEYYLTRTEKEIIKTQSHNIAKFLNQDQLHIIELGAGDGQKTHFLIEHLLNNDFDFVYNPIDISKKAIDQIESRFRTSIPELKVEPICADYFQALDTINQRDSAQKLILFLGSSIGNYSVKDAKDFVNDIRGLMSPSDVFLIGFDLKKDPSILNKAYADRMGVTKSFNLNLVNRLNRELSINLPVYNFDHYSFYNPTIGAMESYLRCKERLTVFCELIQKEIKFGENEFIHTEYSYKYDLEDMYDIASECNLEI